MKIHQKSHRATGFTLIELLVVITIIAVLAGLSFAGVNQAIKRSKKLEATTMATSLVSAIESFYDEYNRLPNVNSEVDTDGDGVELLQILLGLGGDSGEIDNTRQLIFLEGKEATGRRGGIVFTGGDNVEGLFDPFGNPYTVILNTDFEDTLSFSFGSEQVRLRGKQAAVYSRGADEEFNTADDIKSWR